MIKFTDKLNMTELDEQIVENVPCYKCDDIEALLDVDFYKQLEHVAQQFNCGTYIMTEPYNRGHKVELGNGKSFVSFYRDNKKRGPKNRYYLATPELDKFVYEQELFARLTGKIDNAIKRYKKKCKINVVNTQHKDNANIPHLYLDIVK